MSIVDIECPICLGILDESPYARIDNIKEQGEYHVECLEGWIQRTHRGIFCQDRVESYSIYHQSILVERIILSSSYNNINNQNHLTNSTRNNRSNNNDDVVDCCLCTII